MSLSYISIHLLPFDGDQLGESGTSSRYFKTRVLNLSQSHKASLNFNVLFSYDAPASFISPTVCPSILPTGISFVGMGHIGRHARFKNI